MFFIHILLKRSSKWTPWFHKTAGGSVVLSVFFTGKKRGRSSPSKCFFSVEHGFGVRLNSVFP